MASQITATLPSLDFPKEVDYPTQEDWAAFSAAAELNFGILGGDWSTQMQNWKNQANAMSIELNNSADIAQSIANYQGDWVSKGYTLGQSVSVSGVYYICKLTHATGQNPTAVGSLYWNLALGNWNLKVDNYGNGTIAGVKTFSLSPIVPTPPQFSSSVSVATTAFVQNALGNYNNTRVINGSLNLTAPYAGGITIGIMPSTGATLSLPSASSLASGAKFTICNFGNYSFGISLSSGDMYSGFTTGNNYILESGDTVEISVESTGGLWNIVGGSSILKYSSTFISAINAITNEASKTTNGWFKDKKTGLIFQWGTTLSDALGYSTFTHPVTFPNAKLAVIPTAIAPGAQRFTVTIDSSQNSTQWSKVSCWNGDNQSSVAGQVGVSWLIVGH